MDRRRHARGGRGICQCAAGFPRLGTLTHQEFSEWPGSKRAANGGINPLFSWSALHLQQQGADASRLLIFSLRPRMPLPSENSAESFYLSCFHPIDLPHGCSYPFSSLTG